MSDRDLHQRMRIVAEMVETELEALLGAGVLAGEIARPKGLLDAMRYATLAGGKRLRPLLVVETARLFGNDGRHVLRAACAVEMVHCYSLVHDDLPAMDDDDLRRGRPTVHKAFDEALAILAGDALLTYAFDVLADPQTDAEASVRADLVLALARASGVGGMAGGQALDLAAEHALVPLARSDIELLQAMKTGALLSASVRMGAILGRADHPQREALTQYGRSLGAAFQIADDILDATGDEQKLGKKAGKDAARNKATLVAQLGIAGARAACLQFVCQAQDALTGFGERGAVLRSLASFVATRTS